MDDRLGVDLRAAKPVRILASTNGPDSSYGISQPAVQANHFADRLLSRMGKGMENCRTSRGARVESSSLWFA